MKVPRNTIMLLFLAFLVALFSTQSIAGYKTTIQENGCWDGRLPFEEGGGSCLYEVDKKFHSNNRLEVLWGNRCSHRITIGVCNEVTDRKSWDCGSSQIRPGKTTSWSTGNATGRYRGRATGSTNWANDWTCNKAMEPWPNSKPPDSAISPIEKDGGNSKISQIGKDGGNAGKSKQELLDGTKCAKTLSENGKMFIKNTCNFPIWVRWCHPEESKRTIRCGTGNGYYAQQYHLKPFEQYSNQFSVLEGSIHYASCASTDSGAGGFDGDSDISDGSYRCDPINKPESNKPETNKPETNTPGKSASAEKSAWVHFFQRGWLGTGSKDLGTMGDKVKVIVDLKYKTFTTPIASISIVGQPPAKCDKSKALRVSPGKHYYYSGTHASNFEIEKGECKVIFIPSPSVGEYKPSP